MKYQWMKRAAAVLLTAAVSVTLFAGCGLGGTAKEPESDTVRWFNASYAILTQANRCDYNQFGGMAETEQNAKMVQEMLEESWDVTDRDSADETLDWILTEGHRAGFTADGKTLEEYGLADKSRDERVSLLMDSIGDLTSEDAGLYADWYEMYEQYGEHAIDAWDYCRALNLMSFYYIAGYYTKEEALDKSLEIAKTLQPLYESWDDLEDSYLRGYEYWAEESSDDRREIYDSLKEKTDNPYAVDYHTTLEKTWE